MKAKLVSLNSEKAIESNIFSFPIREDITQKCYEIEKEYQPFGPIKLAGMSAAAGKIRHLRKVWKTGYGHGISRVPRRIFWRRGTQFYWKGAIVTGTVGGRRAHPPRTEHFMKELKINKKEAKMALFSAISATASEKYIQKRYTSLGKISFNVPFIIDDKILGLKVKEFSKFLNEKIGNIIMKEKTKRAGRGKDEKYKRSAGLLLVISDKEKYAISGMDVKQVSKLQVSDLYPLGRLTVYTEQAVKELEKMGASK